MDDRRFDALTRTLATGISRRGVLRAMAAAAAGALGARSVAGVEAQVTQAQCGNKKCASNPAVCTNGCVCCDYPNGNSRCRPPGTCSPGQEIPPPTTTTTTTPQATTTSTTTSTTSTTSTTTTTTAAPGCPTGSTDCNGFCCPDSCQCSQRMDGGLSCVSGTTNGQGCTGTDTGACVAGFACIMGQCREICLA